MTQAAQFMTTADVARRFGVVPATVRGWERSGRIRAIRTLSGTRLFDEGEVQRLAAERQRRRESTGAAGGGEAA